MPYTIRHNARTAHLQGIAERTHTGTEFDNSATTGVVTYYAQSACAALTRSGHRMAAYGDTIDSLALALDTFRDVAKWKGLKTCANCERAAVADLESAYDVAELEARSAAGQLDAAENFGDEHRIAAAEERAERAADKYADLADIIGRCRIFGCERPTHEASAWCREHTDDGDTEHNASAVEAAPGVGAMVDARTADYPRGPVALPDHGWKRAEPEAFAPLTVDPEAAYAARRALYRTAADGYEEHGGTVNRDAAAAAWDAFVAAARLAGKCIDFTCYADAAPGADHCQRHHKPVTATLDHTEPGHAVAILTGGHGRQDAPQAWLAHEGGSWLLVDDYDGDTLNVKGPDAERAVHAWAALLGLRIDALTVEVEYAGGPVSPPVRAPERPADITLEWTMVGSDSAAHVFEAHGHAHDYRVIEHPDGAGASLRAVLRGTEVETYRRGYMTPVDARVAAQHYEARYGSGYVPVR